MITFVSVVSKQSVQYPWCSGNVCKGACEIGEFWDERPAGRCLPHRSRRSREEVTGTWEGPVGHSLPLCKEDYSLWLRGPSNNGQERMEIDTSTPNVFHSFKCQSHGPAEIFNLKLVASQQDMSHSAAVVPTFIEGGFAGKEGEKPVWETLKTDNLGNVQSPPSQETRVPSQATWEI